MVITQAQTQAQTRAQLAEAAVTRMLESVDDCSTGDLRRDLATSKAIASKLAAYQVRAAAVLAARERHGDGGAGVLRHATGVSRRQAESQARTARVLEEMPAVREALESGRVSFANAARLAQAAEAGAVEADADLLARAESMPEDRFAREARQWTAKHQPDDGEAEYQRRRARRWLRLWDGDDGMTHLRGEFDPSPARGSATGSRPKPTACAVSTPVTARVAGAASAASPRPWPTPSTASPRSAAASVARPAATTSTAGPEATARVARQEATMRAAWQAATRVARPKATTLATAPVAI